MCVLGLWICEMCAVVDILNHFDAMHECDRQTDNGTPGDG